MNSLTGQLSDIPSHRCASGMKDLRYADEWREKLKVSTSLGYVGSMEICASMVAFNMRCAESSFSYMRRYQVILSLQMERRRMRDVNLLKKPMTLTELLNHIASANENRMG